jgi:hypothetical protein
MLLAEASDWEVNVSAILGLPGEDDWKTLDVAAVSREAVQQVLDAISRRFGWDSKKFWQEIADYWEETSRAALESCRLGWSRRIG